MLLVGLNGVAGSGKDTAAEVLAEFGFVRYAFADKLREVLYALNPIVRTDSFEYRRLDGLVDELGWELAKRTCRDVRELLQRMGTEAGRQTIGPDVWVDALFEAALSAGHERIVITDCRFPNEAKGITSRGGAVWRIERNGFSAVNGHISERALDTWPFDTIVVNNGPVETFREAVRDLGYHLVTAHPFP